MNLLAFSLSLSLMMQVFNQDYFIHEHQSVMFIFTEQIIHKRRRTVLNCTTKDE